MMTEQDFSIIAALIADGKKVGMTAYGIANETKISQPQVTFRLSKLIEDSVVTEVKSGNKTLYYAHDVFFNTEAMDMILINIESIIDTVFEVGDIDQEGIKTVMGFISCNIELSDKLGDTESAELKLISEFVDTLEKYANKKGYVISNIKSWSKGKIQWMALNGRMCACDPDNRKCPCGECADEVEKTGSCLCSIFMRG